MITSSPTPIAPIAKPMPRSPRGLPGPPRRRVSFASSSSRAICAMYRPRRRGPTSMSLPARARSSVGRARAFQARGRVRFPSPALRDETGDRSRGVAQSGSAPGWGPGGRRFKSCLPDPAKALRNAGFCRLLGTSRFQATGSNTGSNFCTLTPIGAMKRPYGSGQIYEKWGAYYGRWRTPDGRGVNRRLGAEAHARRSGRPHARAGRAGVPAAPGGGGGAGARSSRSSRSSRSTRSPNGCASGSRSRARASRTGRTASRCSASTSRRRWASARSRRSRPRTSSGSRAAMLAEGSSPKTVRNVMTFLHSVFALAVKKRLGAGEPGRGRGAAAPAPRGRRRPGPAVPDARPSSTP